MRQGTWMLIQEKKRLGRKDLMVRPLFGLFLLMILFLLGAEVAKGDGCKDTSTRPFSRKDFAAEFPESIDRSLREVGAHGANHRAEAIQKCGTEPDYLLSMKNLEKTVAEVAGQTSEVLDAVKKVNRTLLAWIDQVARMVAFWTLKRVKEPPDEAALAQKVTLLSDQLLSDIFGECDAKHPGCVGKNPRNIREAFVNGNLREQLYLTWNPAHHFIKDIFCHDQQYCACSPSGIQTLQEFIKTDPPALAKVQKDMLNLCKTLKAGLDPQARGRFARANKYFRESIAERRGIDSVEHWGRKAIPISPRERSLPGSGEDWYTGIDVFSPTPERHLDRLDPKFPDPSNLYYGTAQASGFPLMVAMSGSTDHLLNLSCLLGLGSPKHNQLLVLGMAGYMIPHLHHSAYEIMVGARSHPGLEDIPLNSDYYKRLLPDSDLAAEVEEKYTKNGYVLLPTDIYHSCIESYLEDLMSRTSTCSGEVANPLDSGIIDQVLKVVSYFSGSNR